MSGRRCALNSAVPTAPGRYDPRLPSVEEARAWRQSGPVESRIGYQETTDARTGRLDTGTRENPEPCGSYPKTGRSTLVPPSSACSRIAWTSRWDNRNSLLSSRSKNGRTLCTRLAHLAASSTPRDPGDREPMRLRMRPADRFVHEHETGAGVARGECERAGLADAECREPRVRGSRHDFDPSVPDGRIELPRPRQLAAGHHLTVNRRRHGDPDEESSEQVERAR